MEAEKRAKGSAIARTSSSPAPAKAASPAPKVLTVNKKKYEGDPETRKFTTDKVDINRTGSKTRDNCIGLLYNGLAYRSRESEDNVIIRAVEVEAAAYRAYKGETKEYKEKIRSLFQNLKNRQNAELGRNVMSGALPADRFVVLSSKELMSAEQRKADAELEEENLRKAQAPVSEKSISDTFECSNCKQRKVSYTQAQTRSADEPMTTFCECLNCGKRWKVSCSHPIPASDSHAIRPPFRRSACADRALHSSLERIFTSTTTYYYYYYYYHHPLSPPTSIPI